MKQKKQKGFSIIEVLGAIFLLLVGLIGSLSLITQVSSYTSVAASKLVASYLAQEGIEIVRNMRDQNWVAGNPWDTDLSSSPADYHADYTATSFLDLRSGGAILDIDNNGFYNYSGVGTPSIFTRTIHIEKGSDDQSIETIKVLVTVSWNQAGGSHSVKAQEYLYNWR